jgi:hypothetical protein
MLVLLYCGKHIYEKAVNTLESICLKDCNIAIKPLT